MKERARQRKSMKRERREGVSVWKKEIHEGGENGWKDKGQKERGADRQIDGQTERMEERNRD